MDNASCNVVYVDRTALENRVWKRGDGTAADIQEKVGLGRSGVRHGNVVQANAMTLLGSFSEVHLCTNATSCITKLHDLNRTTTYFSPTILLIDIPYEDALDERHLREASTSPGNFGQRNASQDASGAGAYGLGLLQWIASEIQRQSLSKLIVPVALLGIPEAGCSSFASRERTHFISSSGRSNIESFSSEESPRPSKLLDQILTAKCLDIGAVDVLTSPLLHDRVLSLARHAYRARKDASKSDGEAVNQTSSSRKRSWVGLDEKKPYAYMREVMVSGLMDGICRPEDEGGLCSPEAISVRLDRREEIVKAVGSWDFSAHEFSDDELLHAAFLMIQHTLQMPELETWRISEENITAFLVASRSAYNAFVPYHNFRHVVDVLQATFHFLLKLGRLPNYPGDRRLSSEGNVSPIAALIRPIDALTLLITSIGHDVGHPGVNNAFLVTLNAPLAQLYNDRSVLESFHCAAYSQILRRHWPAVFNDVEMRQLMINAILATDMGLHFDYMKRLGYLQEKLHDNGGTDGWNGRTHDENRTLACSLLIKCADISNVARRYQVAAQWTDILTDEFARQACMEKDLGISSTLFAPPVRELVELGKSQIGFINMFAMPLFQGVTDVMPGMAFCVDELFRNIAAWEEQIAQHCRKAEETRQDSRTVPPRKASMNTTSARDESPSRLPTNLRMQAIFNQKDSAKDTNGWFAPRKGSTPDLMHTSSYESLSPGSHISPRSAKQSSLAFDFPNPPTSNHALSTKADVDRRIPSIPPYDGPSSPTNRIPPHVPPRSNPSSPCFSSNVRPHSKRVSDSTTEGSSSMNGYYSHEHESSALSNTEIGMHDRRTKSLSSSTQKMSVASSCSKDCEAREWEGSGGNGNVHEVLNKGLRKKPSRFRMGLGDGFRDGVGVLEEGES